MLFDAYGTLLELDDPVGRLRRGLARAGYVHDCATVAAAFRSEVAFYRRHQDSGRDRASLERLRMRCATVFAEALPSRPRMAEARTILMSSFVFRLFDDVVPALDALAAAGLRLGVVSNWDVSLTDVLRDLGILDRFASLSVSAAVGVRKPDPRIFLHALSALGAAPGDVLHVGDDRARDLDGARSAGVRAVLIDRAAGRGDDDAIASLRSLPAFRV